MIEIDKIYNEDCLQGMKRIDDGAIDLIVTDPPYDLYHSNVGSHFALSQRTARRTEKLGFISNSFDYEAVFNEFLRLQKIPNMIIFCSNRQISRFMGFFEQRGLSTNLLVWYKTNASPLCAHKYMSDLEYIVYVRGKGAFFNDDAPFRCKSRIFTSGLADSSLHPTQKGIDHIRQYIIVHSREGETILDPFMGSATTAVACIKERRHFVGFELNEEYFRIGQKRIDEAKRELTLF